MRNATPAQARAEADSVIAREAPRLTFDSDVTTGARLLLVSALTRLARQSDRAAAARLLVRLAAELELGRL